MMMMDDKEIRGLFLMALYERRDNAGGWVPISENNFSGGEPVTREKIASTGRYLSESGLIKWKPLAGGNEDFNIGTGQINAAGINLIEGSEAAKIPIHLPKKATFLGVEAKGEVGSFVPTPPRAQPPMGWYNQDDTAQRIIAEQQRRRANAAQQSFSSTPIIPTASTTPAEIKSDGLNPDTRNVSASIEQPEAVTVSTSVTRAPAPANQQVSIESRLSARPTEVRDAAIRLATALRDQIAATQSSKPNDEKGLKKYNEFVDYLGKTATELDQLAETLDHALDGGIAGSPDKIFIGKAAEIVNQLSIGFSEWLEANRANVAGYAVKVAVFAAGYGFLSALGVDANLSTILSGILSASFPNAKATKKE